MDSITFFSILLLLQSSYMAVTALWSLVHIRSFIKVLGYQTDQRMIKTVGVLLLAIAASGFFCLYTKSGYYPVAMLMGLTAAGLAIIDYYYLYKKAFLRIYLLDGALEVFFLFCWVNVMLTIGK